MINNINKIQTRNAEIFLYFTIFKIQSYIGAKITTKIMANINHNKIGFRIRKAMIVRMANIPVRVIFFTYSSSI